MPDRDVQLGELGPDHYVVPISRPGPFGVRYDIRVERGAAPSGDVRSPDDPPPRSL
jgi:hypothetical protein